MTDDKPTRRDLMKPVQLLGLAFAAALFAGVIALFSMGFFQDLAAAQRAHVLMMTAIIAGITFIVTLVTIALLILAVDPNQVAKTVDRPVLYDDEPEPPSGGPSGPASPSSPTH